MISETAEYFGVSPRSVHRWVADRKIRFGRTPRVDHHSVHSSLGSETLTNAAIKTKLGSFSFAIAPCEITFHTISRGSSAALYLRSVRRLTIV
jgi:hypothetical protein